MSSPLPCYGPLTDALNGGWASTFEVAAIVKKSLSDPLLLPSLSNFESYFVLRALVHKRT